MSYTLFFRQGKYRGSPLNKDDLEDNVFLPFVVFLSGLQRFPICLSQSSPACCLSVFPRINGLA